MLRNDISDKAVINDGGTMNYMNDMQKVPAEGDYIEKYEDAEEDEDDEEDGDHFSEDELLAQMGYGKSEPKRVIKKEHRKQYSDDDDDEDDEEDDNLLDESLLAQMGNLKKESPKHEPISIPTAALNLVSALKGSREKEGKQARECRVSWAPDVYDPPSSIDHFATTNIQRRKSEKKVEGLDGKNRQKMGGKGAGGLQDGGGGGGGKGSKVGGNKGTVGGGKAVVKIKDRKQVKKKHGGSSSKYSNL